MAEYPATTPGDQDQVWPHRIFIGVLPADECEGFSAAEQVDQFKCKILFLEGPVEQKHIGVVVLDDQYPGSRGNRISIQVPLLA